ncbi:MAG: hypothetical protein KIT31_18605 [Deltaproteobacteria bacterium]|nr:hypothetical protein [Deltaproteobacteria bacterium]
MKRARIQREVDEIDRLLARHACEDALRAIVADPRTTSRVRTQALSLLARVERSGP